MMTEKHLKNIRKMPADFTIGCYSIYVGTSNNMYVKKDRIIVYSGRMSDKINKNTTVEELEAFMREERKRFRNRF